MEKLFAYGSLKDEKIQKAVFGRTLQGKPDSLSKYEIFSIRIPDNSSGTFYPAMKASKNINSQVKGVVFQLEDKDLLNADRYEGDSYRRKLVMLESGIKSWVYVAKEGSIG